MADLIPLTLQADQVAYLDSFLGVDNSYPLAQRGQEAIHPILQGLRPDEKHGDGTWSGRVPREAAEAVYAWLSSLEAEAQQEGYEDVEVNPEPGLLVELGAALSPHADAIRAAVAQVRTSFDTSLSAWEVDRLIRQAWPAVEGMARKAAKAAKKAQPPQGRLYDHYGAEAAPGPTERGYAAPDEGCVFDSRELAEETLDLALRLLGQPELQWSYEQAVAIEEGWKNPHEVEEEALEGVELLQDLLVIPEQDCAGQPLSSGERRRIGLDTVRLAMDTTLERGSGRTWRTGDPDHGATEVTPQGFALPRWAALAVLADFYSGARSTRIVRVDREEAARFLQKHHSKLPEINLRGLMYAIGLTKGFRLVAVATAGAPTGRWDRSTRVDPRNVLEVTRIASDGTSKGATSKLLARLIDLLPRSQRAKGPSLLVTYSLLSERGAAYRGLKDKGLRPVALVGGKARQGKGSRRSGGALAEEPKIRWEAGPAALPARWDLLDAPAWNEGAR